MRAAARAVLLFALASTLSFPSAATDCRSAQVALQVLGSGGPIADDGRASSGYLVWHRGRARVLVDAGGGSFVRYGEAGAKLEDLDLIALTHLHTDHVADLPALLKGGYFSSRTRPLPITGPNQGRHYPGTRAFLQGLFDPERGVFRYLSGYLDGSDDLFPLQTSEVDASSDRAHTVYDADGLRVQAVGVHHGPVPALGYLVTVENRRIAFSGDQNASRPGFARLIAGADLLVMDHAIGTNAGSVATNLHATPTAIGRLAAQAQVRSLLLSHLMARSLRDPDGNEAAIRQHYQGPLQRAEDLQCVALVP